MSHQAPALLIKIRYPKKFDGVILCFGAMIPDFNGIIDTFYPLGIRSIRYSLLGLIVWTLPIALILTIFFSRYLDPWISKLTNKENFFLNILKSFGMNELHYLKNKKFNHKFFIVASISAIIGGFTHLLLDLPSHENVELFYPLTILSYSNNLSVPLIIYKTIAIGSRELIITQFTVIWIIEDIIFFITSLCLLRYLKKHNLIYKWYQNR